MLKIKTFAPELFSDLIERIWIAENKDEAVQMMVPPNQYINLIFPINNSVYQFDGEIIDSPQIEGISLENRSISYPAETKLLGIRFYAYGIYPFLKIDGKQLINKSINCPIKAINRLKLDNLNNDLELSKPMVIYEILKELFKEDSYKTIQPLKEFYNYFRWNDANTFIEDFCNQRGTNYSTLNRNFTRITGISTKKFERLIKFRKSLCSLIDSEEKLTSISADSGYFDQSHFIREFKLFINTTPSHYQSFIREADKDTQIINYNFRLF